MGRNHPTKVLWQDRARCRRKACGEGPRGWSTEGMGQVCRASGAPGTVVVQAGGGDGAGPA